MKYFLLTLTILLLTAAPCAAKSGQLKSEACTDEFKARNIPKARYKKFMMECMQSEDSPLLARTQKSLDKKALTQECREEAASYNLRGDAFKLYVTECAGK